MNLLENNTFKDDTDRYLKESIDNYKLKYNSKLNILLNESKDDFLFYENGYCIISLNLIDSFPYQDVTPNFYLKNKNNHKEIIQKHLRPFLEIDDKAFTEFCLDLYSNRHLFSKAFKNSDKGGIYFGLYSLNLIFLNYYMPFFIGEKSYENYLEFIKQ